MCASDSDSSQPPYLREGRRHPRLRLEASEAQNQRGQNEGCRLSRLIASYWGLVTLARASPRRTKTCLTVTRRFVKYLVKPLQRTMVLMSMGYSDDCGLWPRSSLLASRGSSDPTGMNIRPGRSKRIGVRLRRKRRPDDDPAAGRM